MPAAPGLTEARLTEMLRFANTAAYLVAARKGAVRSIPERDEVERLLWLCRTLWSGGRDG